MSPRLPLSRIDDHEAIAVCLMRRGSARHTAAGCSLDDRLSDTSTPCEKIGLSRTLVQRPGMSQIHPMEDRQRTYPSATANGGFYLGRATTALAEEAAVAHCHNYLLVNVPGAGG